MTVAVDAESMGTGATTGGKKFGPVAQKAGTGHEKAGTGESVGYEPRRPKLPMLQLTKKKAGTGNDPFCNRQEHELRTATPSPSMLQPVA